MLARKLGKTVASRLERGSFPGEQQKNSVKLGNVSLPLSFLFVLLFFWGSPWPIPFFSFSRSFQTLVRSDFDLGFSCSDEDPVATWVEANHWRRTRAIDVPLSLSLSLPFALPSKPHFTPQNKALSSSSSLSLLLFSASASSSSSWNSGEKKTSS